MRNEESDSVSPESQSLRFTSQAGKVGKAFLMWLLGVPGVVVLAYLFFSSC